MAIFKAMYRSADEFAVSSVFIEAHTLGAALDLLEAWTGKDSCYKLERVGEKILREGD